MVLVLWLLDYWTRAARYRARQGLIGEERAKAKRKSEAAMSHATESIFMLVGQGGAPNTHSWSVKFLFICWAGARARRSAWQGRAGRGRSLDSRV